MTFWRPWRFLTSTRKIPCAAFSRLFMPAFLMFVPVAEIALAMSPSNICRSEPWMTSLTMKAFSSSTSQVSSMRRSCRRLERVRAVQPVHGEATPARDHADHLVARHGLAAAGEEDHQVVDALDGQPLAGAHRQVADALQGPRFLLLLQHPGKSRPRAFCAETRPSPTSSSRSTSVKPNDCATSIRSFSAGRRFWYLRASRSRKSRPSATESAARCSCSQRRTFWRARFDLMMEIQLCRSDARWAR